MKVKIIIALAVAVVLAGLVLFRLGTTKEVAPISDTVKSNQVAENSRNKFTIVAFGDSLTAGYGVSLNEGYPSILEKELQKKDNTIQIINMGVSGETTTGALERVDFVISQRPNLFLLGLGANDMLRSSSPAIAKKNLSTILKKFKDANIPVVLLGMKSVASNGKEYAAEFDSMYPSLAQEFNTPLVPFFLEGVVLNPSLNTSDGIHPNSAGYEKIVAQNILPVLNPVLKKLIK
jgi:acyl-CoA thioesterase-1